MSEMNQNELSALESALLGPSFDVNSDELIAVKAEDVQQSGGIDFSKHFFEPRVGETYLIKLLPNPGGDLVTARSIYKNLPDPDRKGKTFHYISSGNAKTCPALELFFELHAKAKDGDAVAKQKIEKYLSRTNQGCVKVQILQSPNKDEIGMIRMFTFATFGPNATVANLINMKLNPTKDQIAQGYEREDVFNIFDSSVMSLVCTEATYDGKKGRDFSKSGWAPKHRGAISIMPDGSSREFKATDINNRQLTEEVIPWFKNFLEMMNNDDYNIFKYFAYKTPDDQRLDKETAAYVEGVFKKVNEIIPVIRDCSLSEIANYGRKDNSESKGEGEKNKTNVLEESIPDELSGSVMTQAANGAPSAKKENKKQKESGDSEVDAILNS